jgi:pyruvate,water dikinase
MFIDNYAVDIYLKLYDRIVFGVCENNNMTTIKTSEYKRLEDINLQSDAAGGKALGLKRLIDWNLAVPRGFVILNAQSDICEKTLADFYQTLGQTKVAVRSSALGEDGAEHSFAGLYETVLNVEGLENVKLAIQRCVASLDSHRAQAYQQQQASAESQMCVVVQTMIDPIAAGVLFTADPVSGRHDRLIIDAVKGLGEALVSGDATPDHYEFNSHNQLCFQDLVGEEPILTQAQCQQLISGARAAVLQTSEPLDMEWAIDASGELFWLQARPITTLGSDLHELDTPINTNDILTRCNIGEMMPGASCPLTFSTTGRAIEHGMQHMHVSYASRPAITTEWTQVAMSSGKLFINLSGAAAATSTVIGVDVKSLGLSICGRVIEEIKEPIKRSLFIRIGGMIKLLVYLKRADTVIDAFSLRAKDFQISTQSNSETIAKSLHDAQAFFNEAFCVHLQSSTTSGFASNILQAMVSGGQESTPEEEAEAAKLMAGATGVESAVLVDQLDHVVNTIAKHKKAKLLFVDANAQAALAWLQNENFSATALFQAFLQRHGHRSYRELCMREVCWADAPENLITAMQASVAAKLQGLQAANKPVSIDISSLSRGLRWILPKAHNAVRRREATKSLLVDITNRMKRGYRALGEQLVREHKLNDADQVFFFQHSELMHFVENANATDVHEYWNHHTKQRRIALELQDRLDFEEICVGVPEPIDPRNHKRIADGQLIGRPVSRGVIEAKARVALSVADAALLQAGEILVAPITDVGWTPYFSMIAGLVTDLGSAVSHGAVIAREYGLPAIVNTRIGTQTIKTGDLIRLDADTGIITIL